MVTCVWSVEVWFQYPEMGSLMLIRYCLMRPFWFWSDGGSQVRWMLVEPTGIPLACSGGPLGANVK